MTLTFQLTQVGCTSDCILVPKYMYTHISYVLQTPLQHCETTYLVGNAAQLDGNFGVFRLGVWLQQDQPSLAKRKKKTACEKTRSVVNIEVID